MDKETFEKIIKIGIQAPSGDNTQPWKVIPSKDLDSFTLFCEKEEIDFFDTKNSALMICSGTFLKNIEIAAQKYNYVAKIQINENENSLEMANVSFTKSKKKLIQKFTDKILFSRATNRNNYSKEKLSEKFNEEVSKLKNKNVDIKLIEHNKKLIKILYKADVIRLENKGAHETLYTNLRYWKKEIETRDGLDVNTLGLPPHMGGISMKIMSSWNLQKFLAFTKLNRIVAFIATKKVLNTSQGIGIISIKSFNKKETIEAAMKFQETWLLLTKYGGFLQPFATLPFFLRRLRFDPKNSFTPIQEKKLGLIKDELFDLLDYSPETDLIMVFRYGKARTPKVYSLRKDIKNFIEY